MSHTQWQNPCAGNYYKSQLRYCVAQDYLHSTSAIELYCITLFKLLNSCIMLGFAFHKCAILQLYGYKSVYPSQAYVCIVLDNWPLEEVFWNTCMFCGLKRTYITFHFFTGFIRQDASVPEGPLILCRGARVRFLQYVSENVAILLVNRQT